MHCSTVDVCQDRVLHNPSDVEAVGVMLDESKLNPYKVRNAEPLSGRFNLASEASGASNVSKRIPVPTVNPTVMEDRRVDTSDDRQNMAVEVLQELVMHGAVLNVKVDV